MQKIFSRDVWGMVTSDANASDSIDSTDKSAVWNVQAKKSGYHAGDLNLDTQTYNIDKNEFWLPNVSKNRQVPQ